MKITDYEIVERESSGELMRAVLKAIAQGWEVLGEPQAKPGEVWWQCLVKRFDPHEGQVWVKLPGKRGVWMEPEAAALARQVEPAG